MVTLSKKQMKLVKGGERREGCGYVSIYADNDNNPTDYPGLYCVCAYYASDGCLPESWYIGNGCTMPTTYCGSR